MPDNDALRRLGGGRWETRDGRFAIEPQSGTWVIVDNEQTDELGLPLVRGPFGSLTAAREAIEAARSEGPKASPLAERIEKARGSGRSAGVAEASGPAEGSNAAEPGAAKPGPRKAGPAKAGPAKAGPAKAGPAKAGPAKAGPGKPEPPAEPTWLRDLPPADQRRARDLVSRLERMGIDDPERVVRAEIADGQPALARLAIERALAKALASSKDPASAVRAAVSTIVRGADVELRVSWRLVDDDGRRIERLDVSG